MASTITTLSDVCNANVLSTKWLLAPSLRIGHQWIERTARNGQSFVNLRPTTLLHLALEIVGSELAANSLTLASHFVGPLVVELTWRKLGGDGYLGRLKPSGELSNIVFESILALRLAGRQVDQIEESEFENSAKAEDLRTLSEAYESFLKDHRLVDSADVLNRATARLKVVPQALDEDALIIVPTGLRVAGLEKQFLNALPPTKRIEIRHPADQSGDKRAIAEDLNLGQTSRAIGPSPTLPAGEVVAGYQESSREVQLFRAVGEVNEVREVFRRCLADQQPLDDVEILHTDAATYVPLIYSMAHRYFCEPDRPDGIPVTFAEGIPVSLSRPGRALVGWLEWIHDGYPQRRLVEMVEEGLFISTRGDEEELSFGYLARLLRPLAIGLGADNYLRKLDEQIDAMRESPPQSRDDEDESHAVEARLRRRKGLQALRKLIKQLLDASSQFVTGTSPSALGAAQEFLTTTARAVNELDRYAAEALIEQLEARRIWLDRLGVTIDAGRWLSTLPAQIRVLGSGPRPGHLHVANLNSGGHSGRQRTFVVGLNDHRFPGAALQDPILLDRERTLLSPELATSAVRLRERIDGFAVTLSRIAGTVTLSWPCHELSDDREIFPSSIVLSAHRLMSGRQDADLESLNAAVGQPASFAPTVAEKALDETERWLWLLTDEAIRGTNQVALVETHFPHLARGSEAVRQRFGGWGPFSGHVSQAGQDLDPFSTDAPTLSASVLETAGRCPLAYFFRSGLGLYSPDEFSLTLDPDHWLSPAQFGLLLHDVFRRFMDELTRAEKKPDFDRDHERLAEILREAVTRWRKDIPPPNENAFRIQYWQLIRTCRIFLLEEEKLFSSGTCQPRYFEVALGLESVAGNPLDDIEPTSISLPNGRLIRARGQIDRVDEIGQGKFAVWDYKVGSGYGYDRIDPFRNGRRVQSVLYVRMIEAALRKGIDPSAVVEQFGYFFPSVRAQGLRVQWNANKLAAGLGILERLCNLIGSGAFLATDNVEDCRYCDYAPICRDVNRVTNHSKTLLERDDLVPLRYFRELRRG